MFIQYFCQNSKIFIRIFILSIMTERDYWSQSETEQLQAFIRTCSFQNTYLLLLSSL